MRFELQEPGKNMPEMYQAFVVYRLTEPIEDPVTREIVFETHERSSVMFTLTPAKGQITRFLKSYKRQFDMHQYRNEPPYKTVVRSWIEHFTTLGGVEVLEYKEY